MHQLYLRSEIRFAIVWIILYVTGTSLADGLSEVIGIEKAVTFAFHALICGAVLLWLKKHTLLRKYGLCRPQQKASHSLFYLPLFLIVSVNLWFGVTQNLSTLETTLYIGSMICVGFAEELIFRGFLFKAMSKDNIKTAVIVSSLTFGIGHIVNLFNGSDADLIANLCQVCYACAIGFLFVIIFLKTKSLWPCILTHSGINALNVFAKEITAAQQITTAIFLCAISLAYATYLIKKFPQPK